MKKTCIFALILGIAGVAVAGLHISVNGEKKRDSAYGGNPVWAPFVLGIWTDAVITPGQDLEYYALVVQQSQGLIVAPEPLSARMVLPYAYAEVFVENDAVGFGMPVPAGMDGVFGGITTFSYEPGIPANSTIFDGIMFYTGGSRDTIWVQLWKINDESPGPLLDQVYFIPPEPATLALLAFGGLFMRRK